MTDNTADVSQRKAAIVAGISIILMAVIAGFAYGFVLNRLIVPGDAAATTTNLMASETLFVYWGGIVANSTIWQQGSPSCWT